MGILAAAGDGGGACRSLLRSTRPIAVDERWVEERTEELNLKSYDRSHIEDLKSRYGADSTPDEKKGRREGAPFRYRRCAADYLMLLFSVRSNENLPMTVASHHFDWPARQRRADRR